jgi:hypothetical protein
MSSKKKLAKFEKKSLKKIVNIFNKVIDSVNVGPNGECHIKFKSDFVFETEGSQIFYTKNGRTAIQAKTLHLNPKTVGMQDKIENLEINKLSNKMIEDANEETRKAEIQFEENANKHGDCCGEGGCC